MTPCGSRWRPRAARPRVFDYFPDWKVAHVAPTTYEIDVVDRLPLKTDKKP